MNSALILKLNKTVEVICQAYTSAVNSYSAKFVKLLLSKIILCIRPVATSPIVIEIYLAVCKNLYAFQLY